MIKNYDEIMQILRYVKNVDWYPERESLILEYEYNSYTYYRNRLDNLKLNKDFIQAIYIKPLENDLYLLEYWNTKQVNEF